MVFLKEIGCNKTLEMLSTLAKNQELLGLIGKSKIGPGKHRVLFQAGQRFFEKR
jgi:hypothetical protein